MKCGLGASLRSPLDEPIFKADSHDNDISLADAIPALNTRVSTFEYSPGKSHIFDAVLIIPAGALVGVLQGGDTDADVRFQALVYSYRNCENSTRIDGVHKVKERPGWIRHIFVLSSHHLQTFYHKILINFA